MNIQVSPRLARHEQRIRQIVEYTATGVQHDDFVVEVFRTTNATRARYYKWRKRFKISVNPKGDSARPFPLMRKSTLKRINTLWPQGIRFENWEDALVHSAAWAWRLASQVEHNQQRLSKYDAEFHACNTLSRWKGEAPPVPIEITRRRKPREKKARTIWEMI